MKKLLIVALLAMPISAQAATDYTDPDLSSAAGSMIANQICKAGMVSDVSIGTDIINYALKRHIPIATAREEIIAAAMVALDKIAVDPNGRQTFCRLASGK